MSYPISPAWWPLLALASPILVPWALLTDRQFRADRARAAELNRQRLGRATPLDLPALEFLELSVLVEWKTRPGFARDAGVSYLVRTNLGSMLYDVGFGPTHPALTRNAAKLGVRLDQVDALTISHLHLDHMGGLEAQRARRVTVPDELVPPDRKPCFLPDTAEAKGFTAERVDTPRLLAAGVASTGPLARSLFLFGLTEEQALVARLKDRGLVVLTGCGHPTIAVVLDMVKRLSDEPLYAVGGGLHFPVTSSRLSRAGIELQMLIGTGKPPWQRITDDDLSHAIATINRAGARKAYLSGHDTCDHSLERMSQELDAETTVLEAGATYRL